MSMENEIFMTKQWVCPVCNFPENFTPNCSLCGTRNSEAEPEGTEPINSTPKG